MAHSYSSGLKLKEYYTIRKTRRLPLPGKVLVNIGDKVSYDTEVARTEMPGMTNVVHISSILKVNQSRMEKYMLKKVGDAVWKGEIIARRRGFFGLINYTCESPTTGTIEQSPDWLSPGVVVIREPPIPRGIYSYVPGNVVEVLPEEGVIIETVGAFIQGIFGVGGETQGEISMMADSPGDVLTSDMIRDNCRGKILVSGPIVEGKTLDRAVEIGVKGIITGGVKYRDITNFLGYEIGVAITGQEEKNLTLILTEGFGRMKMADKTFELLKKLEGRLACINGATQIRAGVIRPEIIIPMELKGKEIEKGKLLMEELRPGLLIRIIEPPYFGALGRVTNLPVVRQKIETESDVRVIEAELEDGRKIVVPKANVELIEE